MSDVSWALVIAGAALLVVVAASILRRPRPVPSHNAAVVARLEQVVETGTLHQAAWAMRMLETTPGEAGSVRGALVRGLRFPSENAPLARIGYRVFKWLLLVLAVMLLLLVIFAARTYPSDADVTAVIGAGASELEAVRAADALTDEWVERVKDIGQLFILTPVFPLIGAVIGYIFGVRQASPANGDDDQIDPPADHRPKGDPSADRRPKGDPPEGDVPNGGTSEARLQTGEREGAEKRNLL